MITLKKYANREDAELALHQLLAAGIAANLGGEHGNDLMGGIINGGYCIEVEAADKDQATEILEAMGEEDNISDAELEALALSTPGSEQAVEPSPEEPEPALGPEINNTQLALRGFIAGALLGLVFSGLRLLLSSQSLANLSLADFWRIPVFGIAGAVWRIATKPSKP